jgi:RimJ/RimL family protein N-acetyltransferase
MPPLDTERLLIRPLAMDDLDGVHRILDVELAAADFGTAGAYALDERQQWLQWTILSYEELAKLYQPPYGERAIVLKQTGQVIGACGFVPCLNAFGHLPAFHRAGDGVAARLYSTEFGLFWAMSPAHQRQGYATEAATALIDYAFAELQLERIVATTTNENAASIRVMQKLGMRIERNPYPDPPWLQVVGLRYHPHSGGLDPTGHAPDAGQEQPCGTAR